VSAERFSIAQVTPYGWEQHHEVNRYVERLSDELCKRGHRVLVVAPSDSREAIRESRALVKKCADDPDCIWPAEGCAQVVAVGQSLPVGSSRRSRPVSLPIDVSRTIEDLLDAVPLDFVHVHEPFAPSAASAALRHSRALNVGTFHAPTERLLSTGPGRKIVDLLFGRLDRRTASFAVTRELVQRYFPGEYEVIHPGGELVPRPAREEDETVEIVFSHEEERGALRLFLRALRKLPHELPWQATIWSRAPAAEPAVPLARAIRDRVRFVGPQQGSEAQYLARADIAVAASSGGSPAPQMLIRALAGGAVPIASRLPVYDEALGDGDLGLLFEPRDVQTLAAQLTRLVREDGLRANLHARIAARRGEFEWSRVADEFESLYREVAARRHDTDGNTTVRRRLEGRKLIHVDLHMHTNHSHDCATTVDKLLETAEERGLGAIAVTDHNEISGALEARDQANGVKVIVGEEVKTKEQGEVIGLFLEEKIPRGLTLQETIAAIRDQGGIVYVPHPFDRMHSVPDYEHLLDVVEDIDAIEVFNPRVAFSAFNEEAERFAAKYRIVAGAGSDSHVPQGLGSVKIAMRDFDGPDEFLESLRDADIIRKRTSLLYVQALKFIQTKGTPSGRRATGSGNK
jgi:predicted metal-dependent phosphoesterase TrpH/glycosyltransferase involved in cell wall biosynthesis